MAEQQSPSDVMIEKSVRYLSAQFAKATAGMGKAVRATKNAPATDLYLLQVDFAHMIDEIQRGPKYFAPKVISECNEFLDAIWQKREAMAAAAKAKPKAQKRG
jgi:hypothetical protein